MARQAESVTGGVLSPESSQHYESPCNLGGLCCGDLPSGIPCGNTSQELPTAWNAWELSNPIVLVRLAFNLVIRPFLCLKRLSQSWGAL